MSLHDLYLQFPELYEQIETIANHRTIPFCYLCYIDAPSGRCVRCGTDDLMRHLTSVGVEYGYEWVIEHLLYQEVDEISEKEQEEIYSDFVDSCCGDEVQVGFIHVNTAWAVKQLDPTTFDMGVSDYFMEDAHIEIDGRLYCITAIETWVEQQFEILQKNSEAVTA